VETVVCVLDVLAEWSTSSAFASAPEAAPVVGERGAFSGPVPLGARLPDSFSFSLVGVDLPFPEGTDFVDEDVDLAGDTFIECEGDGSTLGFTPSTTNCD
jgi:hypothetical protein